MILPNIARNVVPGVTSGYTPSLSVAWHGQFVLDATLDDEPVYRLQRGQYRIRFSALKHFGNPLNSDSYEIYYSPPFNLIL